MNFSVLEKTCSESAKKDKIYYDLLKQIDYDSLMSDMHFQQAQFLNAKMEQLYEIIVERSKQKRTESRDVWNAGHLIANEIRKMVLLQGLDASHVNEVFDAIKERAEFLTGRAIVIS